MVDEVGGLRARLLLARAVIDVQREVAAAGQDPREVMDIVVVTTLRLVGADCAVVELGDGATATVAASVGFIDADDVRSTAAVPLVEAGERSGALKVMSRRPQAFDPDTVAALTAMASFISASIRFAHGFSAPDCGRDPLTALVTREHLTAWLAATMSSRMDTALTLFVLDLDGFRAVNAIEGRAAGDRLLYDVARALESAVRTGDLVARIGGDEFAVACAGIPARDASRVALRLQTATVNAGSGLLSGARTGIAHPGADDSAETWLARAEAAVRSGTETYPQEVAVPAPRASA